MAGAAEEIDVGVAVRITNRDKVFFPLLGAEGTKEDSSTTTGRSDPGRC